MDRKISFDFSLKSIFSIALTIIVIALLFYIRDILVLLLFSFILSTALKPLIDFFEKKHVPRLLSIAAIYLSVALIFYSLVRLMIPPLSAQLNQLVSSRQEIARRIIEYFSHLPLSVRESIQAGVNKLPDKITEVFSSAIIPNVLGVFSGLLGLVTVLVSAFYLLLEKNAVEKAIKAFWPIKSEKLALELYEKIVQKISFWARGQIILSTSVGFLVYFGLLVLRFDYALLMALTAAVLDVFPIIGPAIMVLVGFLLAFATSPILSLWVVILLIAIQQFEANVLAPQIMKKAVGIPPVLIIFSILIGAKLLGFVGVIIAVPVASAVLVILETLHKKELA